MLRGKLFFFANYEGLRRTKAMTMIDTVPTAAETLGDFSESGVAIYNPFSSRNNPDFDPAKPATPQNARILRDPFPENGIPSEMIHRVASTMLGKYVPRPNMMGDMGMNMTMMGQPVVFGSGTDSNNFMDVRNSVHHNDQGTLSPGSDVRTRRLTDRALLDRTRERIHAAESAWIRRHSR